MSDDDDIDLVRRALEGGGGGGDRAAMLALARRVNRVLSARADAFRRSHAVTWSKDDMIGDVWVALVEHGGRRLRAWDPKLGRKLDSWVALIARNVWLNKLQPQRLPAPEGPILEPVSPERPIDERLISAELARLLWAHLTEVLPAKGLVVLRLVFSFGLSPDECARVVGQTRQWVDNWLFRIRTEARKFLASYNAT